MLSKMYLTVTEISMTSLKLIGQFKHICLNRRYELFNKEMTIIIKVSEIRRRARQLKSGCEFLTFL